MSKQSNSNHPLIVITGPTASGKTSLSHALAKEFDGEIICADSMTVYRGMNIGTDKPKELNDIPHHLLDILNPDEEFNVSIFKGLAEEKIKGTHERGHVPFLVGGSTMYIDALVYNYQIPEVKPDKNLRGELAKKTNAQLFSQLIELDPDAEWTVDKGNKRRLIRALEVSRQTGKPFTQQKKRRDLPKNVLYLALQLDREELYERINSRVDKMMIEGFLDEVKNLHKKYDLNTAMQATGYRQMVGYLEGDILLEEAVKKTKQAHRNYAKRQLTWLKRNQDIVWIQDAEDAEKIIKEFLKK